MHIIWQCKFACYLDSVAYGIVRFCIPCKYLFCGCLLFIKCKHENITAQGSYNFPQVLDYINP